MHRYSSIEFTLNLEIETGIKLIIKAKEEVEKEKAYKQYLQDYLLMRMGFIPIMTFEEYYNFKPKKVETKQEIKNKVNNIISLFKGGA